MLAQWPTPSLKDQWITCSCSLISTLLIVQISGRCCLVGLVVKASASGAEDVEFSSRLCLGDFTEGQVLPVT